MFKNLVSISVKSGKAIWDITAIGYALYKNWDSIKALGSSMWGKIQSAAQAFADWWNSWTLRDVFDGVADFFGIDPHIFDSIVRA